MSAGAGLRRPLSPLYDGDVTPTLKPLCLTVLLTVRAGAEEQAHGHLRALAEETRREPGCLAYNVHHAADNPRRVLIYELYRDEAALDTHRQTAHFARYATGGFYPLVEERTLEFFAPVAVA